MRASLPADLQELQSQFESWRESRTSRRVPIPEPLRQAAQALLARYPASRICRVCRLHPRILKATSATVPARSIAPADRPPAFYALPSPPGADCRLLLERADGARLSVVLPGLDAASLSALLCRLPPLLTAMIQLAPQLKILLALEPVDFRKGVDSLSALCQSQLGADPFSGTLFVFRNRAGTALKLLAYDGTGYWLCLKRFSKGRIRWWPTSTADRLHALGAQQLSVLLYHGDPSLACFSEPWRRLP